MSYPDKHNKADKSFHLWNKQEAETGGSKGFGLLKFLTCSISLTPINCLESYKPSQDSSAPVHCTVHVSIRNELTKLKTLEPNQNHVLKTRRKKAEVTLQFGLLKRWN
jgi:hypothetical protein